MNAKIWGQSTPFGAKKGGGGQLQTKNIIGALAHNSCLYSLYFIRYTWHSLYRKLFRRLWIIFVDIFILRLFDFGGRWYVTLKIGGGKKRLRGGQRRKAGAEV